jgi:hypothetical protein
MIVIFVVIPVFVATVVVVPVPRLVAIPVCLVAIAVSISIPSHLPAAVPPPIVGVMVVPDYAVAEARVVILAKARVISEARFVQASPFQIFPLPLTAQPVVLDIVVAPLRQPLAVSVVVISAPVRRASIVRTGAVPVFGAPGKSQRS